MTEQIVVEFPLDQGHVQSDRPLVYRPWGTRTLKVRVTTGTTTPVLRLRPRRLIPEDEALGYVQAYADDSDALLVTWGGGHEPGPCAQSVDKYLAFESCAPLQPDDENFVYFNVTHTGDDLPETAVVTLEAFQWDEKKKERMGDPLASLSLRLEKPAGLPAVGELTRFYSADLVEWKPAGGNQLPEYDARWWPSADVKYVDSPPTPLRLRLEDGQLSVLWADNEAPSAVIQDHTKPSVLLRGQSVAFELFHFDEWSDALRLWFFWHDLNIKKNHEVPDAERFDLIIRRQDGRVLMACTDLHWRESWVLTAPGKVLKANLGLSRQTQFELFKHGIEKVANKLKDPIMIVWRRITGEEKQDNPEKNPLPRVRRVARREATVIKRRKGAEAHVPMFDKNTVVQDMPERLTSSDVRKG